jgi:signal transduction histidine kinase
LSQITDALKSRNGRGARAAPAAVLACWSAGALVFAVLPVGSDGRYLVAHALYLGAAVFAVFALARAIGGAHGRQRLFWGLLGAGLVANFAGDLGWSEIQDAPLGAQGAALPHAAYLVSYLFFGGALLLLLELATRRITLVTGLDALCIGVSTGILAWYFFLGGAVSGATGWWEVSSTLSWVLFDAALLFLCLVVLSAVERPPFAGALAGGFLAFAVADGYYLVSRAAGTYESGGWPDMIWALGLACVALAALDAAPVTGGHHPSIEPWQAFLFWFGPLSPAVHLAAVLLWAATHPPLPSYVAAGAAIILLYFALRVALVSATSRRLSDEREAMARKLEGGRVLSEMHDTVKQGVHGVSITLREALNAGRRGEHEGAMRMVSNALRTSRETEFQVSRPYDELQTSVHGEGGLRPRNYLRHRLVRFEEYFGIKTHEDLQVPLESLSPMEIAAVYRFAVEAFWNVAKHSYADNMHLESRRVGDLLIVRVRDDGRGFVPADPPPGMGLDYLRERAREVGAEFDVISAPGRGTTVQLRFRVSQASS